MSFKRGHGIVRRDFLRQVGLCGMAAWPLAAAAGAESKRIRKRGSGVGAKRPNVVVIVSDDHCQHIMGCTGDPYIKTPHLDRLASEGVLFENSFCVAGVCSPNRAAILTGQYAFQCGAPHMCWMNHTFHARAVTFPALLQKAGYHTAHIGKWHIGNGQEPKPGYDYYAGFQWVGNFHDQTFTINGREQETTGFSDDVMAEFASDYIATRARTDEPFCLYMAIKSPHLPFGYPERHEHAFDGIDIPKPNNFDEDYEVTGRCPAVRDSMINIRTFSGGLKAFGNSWERYIKSYYRSVMAIDDAVGKVMEALKAAGIKDDTLLIYTTDQGYNLGTHGLTEKHYPYEETMRVPMIVRYPRRVPAGSRPDEMALTIDIAPTVLDYCNVAVPPDMSGRSWTALFDEERPAWRGDFLFDSPTENDRNLISQLAVRSDRHKLITYTRQPCTELYDLQEDPREMRNVAGDPAYAGVLAEMQERLTRLKTETGWSPYIANQVMACWAIGPVPEDDVPHVERALSYATLSPTPEPFTTSARQYEWSRFEALPNTNFDIAGNFGQAPGSYAYLAVPIKLLAEKDPYSILRYVPFRPIKAFQRGRLILECNKPGWQATLNPILTHGDNLVVLRFACDGPPNVQLHAYAAEGALQAGIPV